MSARFASRFMAGPTAIRIIPRPEYQGRNIPGPEYGPDYSRIVSWSGLFLAEAIEPHDFGAFAWLGGFFGGRLFRRFGGRHREGR